MNPPTQSASKTRSLFPVILLIGLIPLASIGCASTPDLTLTSITNGKAYHQGFVQAYTARNKTGDTDVVLVDDATAQKLNGQPASAAVRQVMHIRILWPATSDMKGTAANAMVKWYVIGNQPLDLLEYTGAAFVSVSEDDDDRTLTVSNAVLKPSPAHGTLTDPVGLSKLEGKFTAHADAAKVNQVLGELKNVIAAAKVSAAAVSLTTPEKAIEKTIDR